LKILILAMPLPLDFRDACMGCNQKNAYVWA